MTLDPMFPMTGADPAETPPRGSGTTEPGHTEVEIKLVAVDGSLPDAQAIEAAAHRLGISLDEPATATQIDTYYDDAGLRLCRAGAGLRIRRVGERARLTLKIRRAPGPGDAHQRSEFEFDWTGPPPATAVDLPAEIQKRVEPVVFDEPLQPLVELRTERRTWIATAGANRAEIALDAVRLGESDHPSAQGFDEVEIEQLEGDDLQPWLRLAEALRAAHGLQTSRVDKLQRALELGRIRIEPLKPPALHPDLSLREAALRVFEGHLRRIQKHEIKARTRSGPKPVHKLRVACRRLRSALRTFAPAFGPGELDSFAKVVKRTAKSFDEARDLDVLIEHLGIVRGELPEVLHETHDALLADFDTRRRRCRREARKSLGEARRIAGMGALQRFVEGPVRAPRVDLTPSLGDTARRLLSGSLREVVEHAAALTPASSAAEVHALRLAMKRLRYTGESFATAFGGGLQALLAHTTELQTVLGEFNDAEVTIAKLHALANAEQVDRARLLVLGAWLLIQQRRRREARARIDAAWRRFDPTAMQPALAEALRT